MYATVPDLRAEGVTEEMASTDRLLGALSEASAVIDRETGWFFEPRRLTLQLDGRGVSTIDLPVPPIRIERLAVGGVAFELDEIDVEGAPVQPWFVAPTLRLKQGLRFPHAPGPVVVEGVWGYTEADGSEDGRTPYPIRRATMLLALSLLPKVGEGDGGAELRNRWRIVEETTRDQSYRLAPMDANVEPITGDPVVDRLIARYRRPTGLGAA
jgi:hypothetical protein